MDIIVAGFSFFLLILAIGIKLNRPIANPIKNRFSVLIACRNEEQHLPFLFEALNKLDYPKELYEIIIVDDASKDASPELIKKFCAKKKNARFLNITQKDEEYPGKKAALKLAAEKADYEFLLFTDADCIPPVNWLTSYNKYIGQTTGMVVGTVFEIGAKGLHRFSRIINAGIYASTIGLKNPFSCSGGNLCIKKEIFEKVGGYSKIKDHISGDDKLMLNLIKQEKCEIKYNPESLVYTFPTDNKNRLNQKKRRYGKFGMSTLAYQIIQFMIFLFYLYLPWTIIKNNDFISLVIYYLASIIFLLASTSAHKIKPKIIDFVYILFFPYYLIFFSVLGLFSNWSWK